MSIPVIAIFDIGKTNKKVILFDEQYKIVFERSVQFDETMDDEGDSCENLTRLSQWIKEYVYSITSSDEFTVKAINVSAYGASFVHMDEAGNPVTPLYNYLKAFPEDLKTKFHSAYGSEEVVSLQTASPPLGSLNSGLQLYRLKYKRPDVFKKIKYSLHLPHYISWLIMGKPYSDITSIGCHTFLWDFVKNNYHDWVIEEKLDKKLAPIISSETTVPLQIDERKIHVGVGLHDSSAALIPYLTNFQEPFILLSTGTWCISLNPFNETPLTSDELKNDCLCYLDYKGRPIKASRLFAGNEHEKQVKLLSEHFLVQPDRFNRINFDPGIYVKLSEASDARNETHSETSVFIQRDYSLYKTSIEAYHQLILDIITKQVVAINHVINKGSSIKNLFVDGGFSKNAIFMNALALAFPNVNVSAASMSQATALGAALAIHKDWNEKPLSPDLIKLKRYPITQNVEV